MCQCDDTITVIESVYVAERESDIVNLCLSKSRVGLILLLLN